MFNFRCPGCRNSLLLGDDSVGHQCRGCGWIAATPDGILDFVPAATRRGEREYYEHEYAGVAHCGEAADVQSLAGRWNDPCAITDQLVWKRLGPLKGKRVVLLGNGASEKELYFLTRDPEVLVYSDLSPAAVRGIRARYDLTSYGDVVCFAAIDAFELPLFDESVDLIYGYAFVHHLPKLDDFFAEAARVLRPGGKCVFMDDAYAPLWQGSKQTWLRPLMRYTHRRNPVSPEDLRFTLGGGFREQDLAIRIRDAGGEPWFYRQSFLYYFWTRAADRLFPRRLARLGRNPRIATRIVALDERLSRFQLVQNNLIRLVWGFDKPRTTGAAFRRSPV
jgi:SAM-dependent methyltransferase